MRSLFCAEVISIVTFGATFPIQHPCCLHAFFRLPLCAHASMRNTSSPCCDRWVFRRPPLSPAKLPGCDHSFNVGTWDILVLLAPSSTVPAGASWLSLPLASLPGCIHLCDLVPASRTPSLKSPATGISPQNQLAEPIHLCPNAILGYCRPVWRNMQAGQGLKPVRRYHFVSSFNVTAIMCPFCSSSEWHQ